MVKCQGGATAVASGGVVEKLTVQTGGSNYTTITAEVELPGQQVFTADSTYTDDNGDSQPVVDTLNNAIYLQNHPFETGDQMDLDSSL